MNNLREFYEVTYPAMHPDIDAGDALWKFELFKGLLYVADGLRIQNILEIGCGSGRLLEMISSYFHAPGFGIDLSCTTLTKARKKFHNICLLQGDAASLPVKIDRLDIVYFADLLEHLEEPEAFLSLFKDHSLFFMLVPLESGLISNLLYNYRRFFGKVTTREVYGHLHRWRRRDILEIIKRCNLNLVKFDVKRVNITSYQSLRGKMYGLLSESVYFLSPRLHERLLGGWTFVGVCSK